jgi:hypothetical protein
MEHIREESISNLHKKRGAIDSRLTYLQDGRNTMQRQRRTTRLLLELAEVNTRIAEMEGAV